MRKKKSYFEMVSGTGSPFSPIEDIERAMKKFREIEKFHPPRGGKIRLPFLVKSAPKSAKKPT